MDLGRVTAELLAGGGKLKGQVNTELPGMGDGKNLRLNYEDMTKAGLLVEEINAKTEQIAQLILNTASQACSFVAHEEQQEGILKLIG